MEDLENIKNQFHGFLRTSLIGGKNFKGIKSFNLPHTALPKTIPLPDYHNLGKRAEYFFQLAITHAVNWETLATNLQVVHHKRTLGEFDFFVRHKPTAEVLHIELAYKFYIYNPDIPLERKRWIGPNRRDALDQKLDKLWGHQFPLLNAPAARQALHESGLTLGQVEQRLCFKAKLFVPRAKTQDTYPGINADCIVGYWLHWEEFDQEEYRHHLFFTPEKKMWFDGPEHNTTWKNFANIKTDIQTLFARKKSPLVYMKSNEGRFEQFFVVWW